MESEEKATLYEDIYDSVKPTDDFEIANPQHAAEIYRNYYCHKNSSDKAINEMYQALTKQNQFVINNMITYFIPEKYKNKFVSYFYKTLKKHYNITDYKVAQIIFSKISCEQQTCYSNDENIAEENIKKMLERITKQDSLTSKNINYLSIFCESFSIDKNVLFSGQGYKIELDEKELDKLLDEKNINPTAFIKKVMEQTCQTCPNKNCNTYNKESYSKFLYYDKMELAKIMAKLLDIPVKQIITETPLILTIENDLFINRYRTLSFNNQETIYELMKHLYYIQYATFNGDDCN